MLDYGKIFENKSASVFDNMDRLMRMINEAEGDEENTEEEAPAEDEGEGGGEETEAPTEDQAAAPEETAPEQAENAEEEDGIFISDDQKAVLAKSMLDALLCTPPQPGEIPQEFLNVTNANADQVISLIQSYMAISANKDLTDINSDDNMVGTLKDIS